MTRLLVDSLIAGIAPWRCILCQGPGAGIDLCRGCLRDLPWLAHTCARCGIPLPPDQAVCGRCLSDRSAVDYFVAARAYEYPLDRLISALKFKRHLYVARLLGELLTLRLQEAFKVQEGPKDQIPGQSQPSKGGPDLLDCLQALTSEGIDFSREKIFETPHPYPQNDFSLSETIEVPKAIGFIVELDKRCSAEHSTDQLVMYSGSDHIF